MTLAQQRRFSRNLLKSIKRYSATDSQSEISKNQRDTAIDRYLNAHGPQSVTLHRIWLRKHGKDEARRRWEIEQVGPIVPRDYRRLRSNTIRFFHKPRTTEGVRKVCSLPDTLIMWHMMAKDLIVAQHNPRPHIGDWRGRGRDWQIDQIVDALKSPDQVVVSADIKSAFASVNFDTVYELPYLPEELIRRALDYRSHRFVRRERSELVMDVLRAACSSCDYHHDYRIDLERSPSGLMEGSPASNAIFSVLLDDLPDHVGEGIQAFVYCDNIILLAPSMSCAQRAEEALARYLSGHRAGPFEMRREIIPSACHFEHLGYSIKRNTDASVEVSLSLGSFNKLGSRLEAEDFDPSDTRRWLYTSYGKCSPQFMAVYFQMIQDEAGFRSI